MPAAQNDAAAASVYSGSPLLERHGPWGEVGTVGSGAANRQLSCLHLCLAPSMAMAPRAARESSSGQEMFPLLTHEVSCRAAVVYK